jgi:hypothetical protein
MNPLVPRKGSYDPAGGVKSIDGQPESLKSGWAHRMSSPLWNFHGPFNSTLEDPRTTCSAHREIGADDVSAVGVATLWGTGADCAHKGWTIVPRHKAAMSIDIFLFATDNRNTRIWEVPRPTEVFHSLAQWYSGRIRG